MPIATFCLEGNQPQILTSAPDHKNKASKFLVFIIPRNRIKTKIKRFNKLWKKKKRDSTVFNTKIYKRKQGQLPKIKRTASITGVIV